MGIVGFLGLPLLSIAITSSELEILKAGIETIRPRELRQRL